MSPIPTSEAAHDNRAVLSALWITVLLNVLFRDVHEILRPGLIAEVMTGSLNGVALTDGVFLGAALLLQIPIAMVVLSHVLPPATNRRVNSVAALAALMALAAGDRVDADDAVFAVVQALALLVILWLCGQRLTGRRMVARTAVLR